MPSDRFDANAGFSVNNTTVIDAARNISAVGATLTTVTATTYRNLPQGSATVTGVASFNSTFFTVSSTGHVVLAPPYSTGITGPTGSAGPTGADPSIGRFFLFSGL